MTETEAITAVRHFNRFYTQRIGILQDSWLRSAFSLTEARVLYEIAHRDKPTASDIIAELGLDAGYLSRILRRFQQQGLIRKESSRADGRRSHLSLTAKGRKAYAPLETHANAEVSAMLSALQPQARNHVVTAMRRIEETLHGEGAATPGFILRPPRPGDFGWIVSRHAVLYGEEQGWSEPFEGLCAQIVADFANKHDPRRERCWIAERNGENAGSIFLVKDDADEVARIRLLLVEPSARGLGIGDALVDACIGFAREAGYRRITLWTHQVLAAARSIYQKKGFTLSKSWTHNDWGPDVVGETWDLDL